MSTANSHAAGDRLGTAQTSSLDRLIGGLASARGVALFWLVYGLLFSGVYYAFTRTLARDDAVSMELMQRHLAAGYQIRNPPMFEWLLWAVQEVLGPELLSFVVLRYALIGIFGVLVFVAVRQATGDRLLAGAFSISLPMFFWLGWDFHYRVTHTLGLLVFGLGAWIFAIRYREQPNVRDIVLTGLLCGLSLISKWNFVIFLGALLIAFATDEKGRAALLNWRTLLGVAAAAVPVVPPALWLLARRETVTDSAAERLIVDQGGYLSSLAFGMGDLVLAVVMFVLPWIALVLGAAAFTRQRPAAAPTVPDAARFAARTTLVAICIAVALVAFIGPAHANFRYMYPLFLVLPVAIAGYLAGRIETGRFARTILGLSAGLIAVALVIRGIGLNLPDPERTKGNDALLPYAALAKELDARGWGRANIVASESRDAGNLLSLLPEARARGMDSKREDKAPLSAPGQTCVVLWKGGTVHEPASAGPGSLPSKFQVFIPGDVRAEIISIPVRWPAPLWGPRRVTTWHALAGAAADPVCANAR